MRSLLAAVLLLSSCVMAEAAPSVCTPDACAVIAKSDAEPTIRKAETDWAAAMATDEAPVLRRILADNAVVVIDGRVSTSATMLARAAQRRPGLVSDTLDRMTVTVYGPVSVAEGSEHFADTASGRRDRIVWSDTWVRCGNEWRLVGAVAVTSPEK